MKQEVLRAVLLKFADQSEVSASKLSDAQRRCLDDFCRRTGGIQAQLKGRGMIYRVQDQRILDSHLAQLAPARAGSPQQNIPSRAINIAQARSSKSGQHQHEGYYLLLKSVDPAVAWRNVDTDCSLELGRATADFGAAVLHISPQDGWRSDGELWFVENQALFDRLDWLPYSSGVSVAYYSGQLSRTLLQWLGAHCRAGRIMHFPDYDGVGISNFSRLHQTVGTQCELWLMPQWEEKLKRYGSNQVWRDTNRHLDVEPSSLPFSCRQLVELMRLHGLALEQESIWLEV